MSQAVEPKRVVMATIGHVDHGKTSLVRALTGVDTDRLAEEKRRGISIELGFAELAGAGLSFVDVPGHERLVHTMIAGVGGVDALLLVVAADDGVMPQTREHLAVCSLLGVRRVVVALSKTDLVDGETLDIAEAEIREMLRRFELSPDAVVRTSTKTQAGLSELERRLRALVTELPARAPSARLWLAVDRAFSLKGIGTVVTGTLARGRLQEGDALYLAGEESVLASTCRSLEVHGQRVVQAGAPARLAINLAGLSLDEVRRGQVLSKDPELPISRRLAISVHWLPGLAPETARSATLVLHVGTARAAAKLVRLGDELAELALDRPVPVEGGVGVVLRSLDRRGEFGRVVGGGRVLDALAGARRRSGKSWSERRAQALGALARGELDEALIGLLHASRPRPIAATEVERRLGLEPGRVAACFEGSRFHGVAVALDDRQCWIAQEALTELQQAAIDFLRRHHTTLPDELGAPLETLRGALERLAGRPAVSRALQLALSAGRIQALDGGRVSLAELAPKVAQSRDEAALRLRSVLAGFALGGATDKELAEKSGLPLERVRASLTRLAALGAARRVSGLWFDEHELARVRAAVRAHLSHHATLSVPTFKDLLGVSRKQAIPLLEELDRQGVTWRKGDERMLGPAKEK